MCGLLVSCTDFKVIPTPFSEVIWNRYSSFWKNGKADHSIRRWPDITPQIALSSNFCFVYEITGFGFHCFLFLFLFFIFAF